MDIKLTHSLLKDYLDTTATPEELAKALSLCGPTVDRMHQKESETIYDIEIITNRIDSASALGVAREATAILPQFDKKAELTNNPYDLKLEDLGQLPKEPPVKVQILDQSLVSRFACIALEVEVKESPKQTQQLLENLDQRPINNLVDITNELTARFGQPTHVFDLNKIKGNLMKLRSSKKGEKITTLDYKVHTLKGNDIVIEDGEGNLIDLCGIMGGALSAVDENTTKALLFVQKYEPKHIRKTSLYTQERTLASQLFEKDTDPELVLPTLIAGVKLLQQRANGKIISNLIDIYPNPVATKDLELDLNWLHRFVGVEIPVTKVIDILNRLGFKTEAQGDVLVCTVPTWRLNDINIKEDLAEEIARVYGYFKLPSNLPPTTISPIPTAQILKSEMTARKYLSHLGFTEIYNYALISEDLFRKAALNLDNAIKVNNPLSSDYEYMRTSLIPSLLYDLDQNRGKVKSPVRIFELSNTYLPTIGKELPEEISTLGVATQGLSLFETKGYLEALAKKLHVNLEFRALAHDSQPFIKTQTAEILVNDKVVGLIGNLDLKVATNFQINEEVVIAQLDFEAVSNAIDPIHHFKPVSNFPSIFEDITVESSKNVGELIKYLQSANPLISSVTYITSFQNKHTFRLEFVSYTDNLTQELVTKVKEQVVSGI